MRLIVIAVWSVVISSAISYVLTSMAGEPFNFMHTLGLAGVFFVAVSLLGEVLLEENPGH